jgi:membrane-associated protease RseP (regulator of RpoE activity)
VNAGPWIFFAAVVVVVMVHESGHFLVAKAFDFKATKFFFGFGPTLWSFTKGETEYGVKLLPFGGFVRIVGMSPYEEVPPEDQHRSYPNKPKWQRALVLVAGSATHWVVAFLVIVIFAMTIGFPTGDVTTQVAEVSTSFEGRELPAAAAGFLPDDRIVAANGSSIESWDEVSSFIKAHPDEEVTFTVDRDGRRLELDATLGEALFGRSGRIVAFAAPGEELPAPESGQAVGGFLGISPEPEFQREGLVGAIGESGRITWDVTWRSVLGIPSVFAPVFNGDLWEALQGEGSRRPDEAPLGLVGVGRIASESVERGRYLDLMQLIVFFTIFVGIMNLLPLPPLDGGHLAVVGYEAITGRTVDVRKLIPLAAAVISFFVLLFLAVLYLDLARPIEVPF